MTDSEDVVLDDQGRQYLEDLRARLLKIADESPHVDYSKRLGLLAGGGGVSRCPTETFLGYTFCQHTVVKIKALIAAIGIRAVIAMIQGSYTTSTTASAGTHAGGGAGDQKLSNLSGTLDTLCMNTARDVAFLIYWVRPYIAGLWANHGHFIDPSCPNLSPEAAAQVVDFYNGKNGLANNGPDFGSRKSVSKLWGMYLNRANTTVASIEALFASTQPKEWWQMAIPDEDLDRIADRVWDRNVDNPVTGTWDADTGLWSTNKYAMDAAANASKALGEAAAARQEVEELKTMVQRVLDTLAATPNPDQGPVNPWPKTTGPIYGADVSGHQDLTVCQSIAADATKKFVIVKATEGKTFNNDLYYQQMDMFRNAEKFTGAYHFWWPTNTVQQDLDHFVSQAKLQLGEVPVLDVENWDQVHQYADMKNLPSWFDRMMWAINWLEAAEDVYGAAPWIYLNWNWIKEFRIASGQAVVNADGTVTVKPATDQTELWKRLTHFPLWGANPFRAPGTFEAVSGGWNAGIICHQYGEAPYDLDYLYGADASAAWWSSGIKKTA